MRGEIATRPIAWTGLAIGLTVAGAIVAVFLLLHWWQVSPGADRTTQVRIPDPMLQPAPQLDLRAYREEKQRLVDGAAWLDAQHTLARIPVADAMAMLAASAPKGAAR